jgi:diketogulonate reductase-like aldo/keto reductase
MPNLGLGTWYMGESQRARKQEVEALRYGIDIGARLIDTAEMYGEGEAEEIVGDALIGVRKQIYLVSKFYPFNAGKKQVIQACERSLKRLKTDYLDLYLLHWRGSVPFEETLEALYLLKDAGKIRDYGVSNLDYFDMQEFLQADIRHECAVDQVLYNLNQRQPEWQLKPYCDQQKIATMAYCPLDQGSLADSPVLLDLAVKYQATAAQIALAWLLQQPNTVAIPKSVSLPRVKENLQAQHIQLTTQDLQLLDQYFPAPKNASQGRLGMR